jgi:hypothetical protein
MSSNYLTILQLCPTVDRSRLDHAYHLSVMRYERLTSAGPLRFYRKRLLSEVERAYESLKNTLTGPQTPSQPTSQPTWLARQAAAHPRPTWEKPPIRSDIREGSILAGHQVKIRGRDISYLRTNGTVNPQAAAKSDRLSFFQVQQFEKTQGRTQGLIEDDFCLEVIYRLEGDLIRFDSRLELLQFARQWQIHTFRANMLIAQIVEAVRHHKLYQPNSQEIPLRVKTKGSRKGLILAVAIAIAVVYDLLLIRYLAK